METSGGGIHALSDDALVHIFVRLPSVSVLRCRAVCKDWHRVTTDRSFLVAHAASRPCEMVVQFTRDPYAAVQAMSLEPTQQQPYRFLCDYDLSGDYENVIYSLHGLLVLRQSCDLFVICNPATRQWTNLPELCPQSYCLVFECGFYFHTSSGEYRLLCHAIEKEEEEFTNSNFKPETRGCYYILSAGAILPRRLGSAPSDPSGRLPRYEVPVAHRGNLYWLSKHPQANHTRKMLAFDMASETFRLMSQPSPDNTVSTSLFELDGELCVATMSQSLTSLDIWGLQDYKAETWTLLHRVHVPMPVLYKRDEVSVSKVISLGNGAILIGCPKCNVARMYHLKDKRMICEDFTFGSVVDPRFLVFNESLVPHAFFDSPRCPDLENIYFF
ncbi:hypothetical protein ACQJBY_047613 [Aegilops geniculata]